MYNSGNSSKNVTGASIVDGTVETVDIADDAVTADKLANSVNTDIATGVSGSTTANAALPKAGGTMTGNIKFTGNTTISHDTVDGSDTGVITIAGGGADGHTRGSSISVSGNESGNIGLLLLRTTNQIRNNTGGIERLRIDSTNVTVQTGNLKIATAGKGIDFGTGLGANLLDDYEEGTWTPTLTPSTSGTISISSSSDKLAYTKVGRQVTVTGRVTVTGTSSPLGYIKLSLPFAIGNLSDNAGEIAGSVYVEYGLSKLWQFCLFGSETNDYVRIGSSEQLWPTGGDMAAQVRNQTQMKFGFSYFV